VSATEQVRGIRFIREIRTRAVVALSSAPVPRSASDEGFVRADVLANNEIQRFAKDDRTRQDDESSSGDQIFLRCAGWRAPFSTSVVSATMSGASDPATEQYFSNES